MTTEDDFRRILRFRPNDWNTRLVFADWLQDRGDQRAEGFRALARNRWSPWRNGDRLSWWDSTRNGHPLRNNPLLHMGHGYGELPGDWFANICGGQVSQTNVRFRTRREAEDAAALAFAYLPAERRAELLNPEPVTA